MPSPKRVTRKPRSYPSVSDATHFDVDFDVWGCRGSRNILPHRSKLGNYTSCYSVLHGDRLLILDAGLGLVKLSHATLSTPRFKQVREAYILVTHAHADHWEGLKDAEWFWLRDNGVRVVVAGPDEALRSIRNGFAHPAYVPLDTLAQGTARSLEFQTLEADRSVEIGPWRVLPFSLNHYSGSGDDKLHLSTLGYRLELPGGPTLAYLSDHEPTPDTRALEARATEGADLVLFDSHFLRVDEQMFGHGSIEHAASVARAMPDTLVLSGHLSARYSDAEIRQAMSLLGRGSPNFNVATEGKGYRWDKAGKRFAPRRS